MNSWIRQGRSSSSHVVGGSINDDEANVKKRERQRLRLRNARVGRDYRVGTKNHHLCTASRWMDASERRRRQSSSSNKETQQDPSRRRPGEHAAAVAHVDRRRTDATAMAQKTRKRTLGLERRSRRRSRRPRRDRCSRRRWCTQKRTIKGIIPRSAGLLLLLLPCFSVKLDVNEKSSRWTSSLVAIFATHRCQSDFVFTAASSVESY